MKILVDMNLSPEWVAFLTRPGREVRHWNEVGSAKADDPEIAEWAAQKGFIILTQDLIFSDILFMTQAAAPRAAGFRRDPGGCWHAQGAADLRSQECGEPPASRAIGHVH